MRLIIVTGMSGAGKSTALKFFEDMGFYCVDNLPILLIEKFAELTLRDENNIPCPGPAGWKRASAWRGRSWPF